MPTTSTLSVKRYRCTECGHESKFSTNHWGEIYPRCTKCGWKKPLQLSMVHECLEAIPQGYSTPPKWTMVKLGDVVKVK